MRLSIIIPVYNSSNTLSACLESIRSQSMDEWEMLLIDDGSTDTSHLIYEEYARRDNRIKFFKVRNGGVSRARNIGLENATGEWITFIDSDDYIEPGYLDINLSSVAELQMQNWRVWGGGIMQIQDLQKQFIDKSNISDFCSAHLQYEVFRMCCCKFYRRDIIEKYNIRFLPSVKLGEDTLFMLEYMSHVNSIEVIDSAHYMYWRPSNWDAKYEWTVNDAVSYMDEFYARYKKLPYPAIKLLDFMFVGQYRTVKGNNKRVNRFYWYSAPTNLKVQKELLHVHENRFRIRYYLCFLFSFLRQLIK